MKQSTPLAAVVLLGLLVLAQHVSAQLPTGFPSRPIRMIVGSPPGQ